MELDLKSSQSIVARKHLIKRTEEAIESFLRDDCTTNLKLIGALEEISFRLFAESNDVFLSEALNAPDDNEFQWDDEFMFTRTEDDSGLPDENEWLIESIQKSKPSICSTENFDADYFVKSSPLMMHVTVSPGDLIMTSSTAKFNCHDNAGLQFMLESDEIWMIDTCDQENVENMFFFATYSNAKSTRDSKLHAYSWMITGFKSDKCQMPLTFGPEHLKKRPFLAIHSLSKPDFRGLMSTSRGKDQEDLRAVTRQEASKDGCAEKSEENSKKKKRNSVVRRLFTNERGVEYQGGLNRLEQFMLEEDINIAPTAHVDKYARSYQSEEDSFRSPFHRVEKRNRTLSTRHRSAKEDENTMEIMNEDKSITRIQFYVMDNQQRKWHKETNESPCDEQDWLVISTEDTTGGSICYRTIELSDDNWILISHNEDNSGTHKDSLYYYQEVNKKSLCHQEEPTFDRNVGVTNSLYNSTGIRLAESFTDSRASSTKMQTKVILQNTKMVSRPRSLPPILSFHYESEYDDWIIVTMQDVEKLEASINKR